MRTDVVYEIAMSHLGIEKLETAEQFADLYEHVTNNYDLFNDETDCWPEWYAEVTELLSRGLEPRDWFINKLQQGHDIRSLTFFLCGELEHTFTWDDVLSYLCGRSDSRVAELLPDVMDWAEFQRWLASQGPSVKYRAVRKFFGLKQDQKPTGRAVTNLVERFGHQCVGDDGGPLNFAKRQSHYKKVSDR